MTPVVNGKLGSCTLYDGICPSASCSSNGMPGGNGKICNNDCSWQTPTYTVNCQPYKSDCKIKNKKCFGFTYCAAGDCPEDYIGMFCFFSGDGYTVCKCDSPSGGYVSQCPSTNCSYSYPATVGGPTTCSKGSYCPEYSQCADGNCELPGPDADCDCVDKTKCIGKCCPSTGECKAASCDGNKINNPSGHEKECVVKNDNTNSGGKCPWSDYSFGVKCNYLANCDVKGKVNCWGYTYCAVGTCDSSAVGVFCIQSGNSENFKVCGCTGTNVYGVASNCNASDAPQSAATVVKCQNGNCAPADPYPTCTASCTGGYCIGRCCSATGKCAAASCDGNRLNDPSGHEHECVLKKDNTNAGGQCPWSDQSYGVKCTYLAGCDLVKTGNSNCWGYTTCAKNTCPASALGVLCIQSGNSDNFKICGCTGEGTILPSGAAVTYSGCILENTTVVPVTGPYNCTAGFYCPTPCASIMCPCGSYCPAGSTAPIACPADKHCPENSAVPIANPFVCPSGYYCPIPATNSKYYCTKTICPCGFRCPPGTTAPQKCASPFYCPSSGMTAQALCPIGFKCPDTGMCEAIACPLGTWVTCAGKERCDDCPVGRYCPNVTTSLLCPAGFHCPLNTFQPIPCPAGSFCYVGTKVPTECPVGFFCPAGASTKQPCPRGESAGMSTCPSRRSLEANRDAEAGGAERSLLALAEVDALDGSSAADSKQGINSMTAAAYSGFTLVALFASGLLARRVVQRGAYSEEKTAASAAPGAPVK
jgi:hypothetical protein